MCLTLANLWLWSGLPRPTSINTVHIPENFNDEWDHWSIDELSHQLRLHPFSSRFEMKRDFGVGVAYLDTTAIYNRRNNTIDVVESDTNENGTFDTHWLYKNASDRVIHQLAQKRLMLEDCELEGCIEITISQIKRSPKK